MSSTIFNQTHTGFIHNEENIIVITPTLLYLPQKPVDQRQIHIFNNSGKLISINSNSKSDLMFSSFAAPNGSETITLEDKRMLICLYVLLDNKKKTGIWHVIRS